MSSIQLRFLPLKSFFEKCLLLAITFPHVTLGIVPAETSPFPLLFSLILILIHDKYDKSFIFINIILFFLWIITIPQGLNYIDGIEQLIVYMQNIFVAFYIFKYGLVTISQKFCIFLIFFHLFSGISWILGFSFINDILVFLSSERLGSDISRGQGSRFFATEPSEAMGSIFFILLLYSLSKYKFSNLIVFATLFITALLSSSGTSLTLITIFLVSCLIFYLKWFKSMVLFFSFFIIFQIFAPSLETIEINNRALNLIKEISTLEFAEILSFISLTSGWRFSLDYASYVSIFFFQPMYGIGTAGVNSLHALSSIGIDLYSFADFIYSDIQGIKPASLFATIFLELGIFGLFFTIYFVRRYRRSFSIMFSHHFSSQEKSIFCIAFFKLFFLMLVGTPASLATLFLAFYYIKDKGLLEKY